MFQVQDEAEVAVCGEGVGSINTKEKHGYVKEYMETEGLAMILSKEYGLVLFHLEAVWVEGQKPEGAVTRAKLPPGEGQETSVITISLVKHLPRH